METILGRFAPYFYGLLRIVSGLLFACHGAQKLLGVLGGQQVPVMSQFGLAGVIELVGGLMIAAGVFTSLVAFIASGEMAAAYFQAHAPRRPLADSKWRRARGALLRSLSLLRRSRQRGAQHTRG